ncbi:MAG TPA: copper resistance CopC family protein [Candidatus Limnocylindrales bacterium]|nr:copper resistance CopC family protein [Candidatus Limnocylindrales bacterium]
MHRHPPNRPSLAALLLALGALIAVPPAVAAHAEFERSRPEDGETVQGSPNVIRAFFSEDLGDGSEMALLDEDGATISTGGIDPANSTRLRMDPPDLLPGDYEVQWKAFADDGHLETGTFSFTVSAPVTPPPSLTPTPSEVVSAPPSASAVPTVSAPSTPSPAAAEPSPPANAAGANDVLPPIVAAVVIVGALGGYLLMRRRPARP